MRKRPFRFHGAAALRFTPDVAGDVRRHAVAVIRIGPGFGCGTPGHKRFRRKARQGPGDHVSGSRITRAVPQVGRPGLVVPRHDVALRVQTRAFVHHKRKSVIFAPGHFLFSRELHAHRFAEGLREQGRVVSYRIGGVQPVAAGAATKDHVHIFRFESEKYGGAASYRPDALRRRVQGGLIALNVRHGARSAHRAVHLVGIVIRRLQDRGGLRQLLVHVFRADEQRIPRRLLSP